MRRAARSSLVVLSLVALVGALSACEDLSKVSFLVDYQSPDFVMDLDAMFAQAVTAGQVQGWDLIPEGTCVKLQPAVANSLFALPPVNVDLEADPQGAQLTQYKDHIETVDIAEVGFTVSENTLPFSIPAVELFAGPFQAKASEMTWVATTEEIPKATKGEYPVGLTPELYTELAYRVESDPKFTINTRVGDTPVEACKGKKLGKIVIRAHMKFMVFATTF
jgi:hypothetical protein